MAERGSGREYFLNEVKPILSVQNLKMYFPTPSGIVKAVDDVSFDVRQKEAVALVGESGCGKTMTAFSLLKLVPEPGKICGGKIFLDGKDIVPLTDKEMQKVRGRDISIIFQDPFTSLNPVLTVGTQLIESFSVHQKITKKQARDAACELLEDVGLSDARQRLSQYPYQFSGGMRQRLMMAMALACKPKLLIADEPTTALDVTIQAQILRLLEELKEKYSMAVLLITHDLGVVAEFCDSVLVMYAGKIVEEADVHSLFKNPKHPYTQALLESLPDPDADTNKKLKVIVGQPPDLSRPPDGCRFHPRCEHAMNICASEEPSFFSFSPTHRASCWLHDEQKKK